MSTHPETAESENGSTGLPDCPDVIDPLTFEQILEMDDDEDEREFSKSIVYGFFDQAESTFVKMDNCLEQGDLKQLSSLGHFLKGSSATLGLTKIKDSCEKIQHYGASQDEDGNTMRIEHREILKLIEKTLQVVKVDYKEAEKILKKFYHDG